MMAINKQESTADKNISLDRIFNAYRMASIDISTLCKGLYLLNLSMNIKIANLKEYGKKYYIPFNDTNKYSFTGLCPVDMFKKAVSEQGLDEHSAVDVCIESITINKSGKLTIAISSISVNGISEREIHKKNIIKYCKDNNYYNREKKQLPVFIYKIAMITTGSGNTQSDIFNQTGLKKENMSLYRCNSDSVDIANSLREVVNSNKYQIVVLFRGGNEDEHMIKFSETCVLDEVVLSKIPVVVAIGHEQDHPIIEDIADYYFATPSSFANGVYAINSKFEKRLINTSDEIQSGILNILRRLYLDVVNRQKLIDREKINLDRYMQVAEAVSGDLKIVKTKEIKQSKTIAIMIVAIVSLLIVIGFLVVN